MERPCTCHTKCGDNMLIINLIVMMGDGCLQLATAEAIDQRVIAGYYANPPCTIVVKGDFWNLLMEIGHMLLHV